MSRMHEYNYVDSEISSFYWNEKDCEIEHSINIGGSIVLDFSKGRIVGLEIYDTNVPIEIREKFRGKGELEIRSKDEIKSSENPTEK